MSAPLITRTSNTSASRSRINEAVGKIPNEKQQYAEIVGGIINKARLSVQWNLHGPKDQKIAVAAWLEIFAAARIPARAVNACYLAAVVARREIIAAGKEFNSPVGAEFCAAQWFATVRDDFDKREAGRRLATTPHPGCPGCYGNATGKKYLTNSKGEQIGLSSQICDHVFDGYDPATDRI